MSQGKRYQFQGTTFAVQTALEAAKTITAISKADPAVVSVPAHGYVDDDVIHLSDIEGMTQLDDTTHVIDQLSSGTFALLEEDSTDYVAFVAESPLNAKAQRVTFSEFCELKSFNQQDGAADDIDATTICSTAKEFEVGLGDSGTLSLEYNAALFATVQVALRAAKKTSAIMAFKIVFPKQGGTVIMFGSVQQQSISGAVGQFIAGTATIRLTGDIIVIEA